MADRELIAAVLDGGFLDDLAEASTATLRERRGQCDVVEAELSYRRRVLHGHLDLLRAEIQRRDLSVDSGPITSLLDSLGDPAAIAATRSPSHQRVAAAFDPGQDDDAVVIISADLPDCSDDELRARGETMVMTEQELSGQRRTVLAALDAIQGEIVRRYRDGVATIDEILPSTQ